MAKAVLGKINMETLLAEVRTAAAAQYPCENCVTMGSEGCCADDWLSKFEGSSALPPAISACHRASCPSVLHRK